MYVPPVVEILKLAEVEHNPRLKYGLSQISEIHTHPPVYTFVPSVGAREVIISSQDPIYLT